MLRRLVMLLQVLVLSRQNVISIAQGQMRGVAYDGYIAYTGIPYATVTSAKDRFKMAGIAPIWSSIRESRISTCSTLSEAENCLQLDVYVPSAVGTNWPVLVWVTGGTGPYNPGHLVREGIIVVIVHHRIGPQGFLCLNEEAIPGNAALKDVILALRWVRDNIVAFYGNPSRVVAAGQSFGAAIVDSIMLSSMASGLFHGAILQSGTALCPWAFNYDAQERAMALTDNQDLTKYLLETEIEELITSSNKLDAPYFPFGICSEKPLKNEERLLNAAPYDLLTSNKVKTVPMMIGYNSNEAYVFTSILQEAKVLRKISRTPSFLLPDDLRFLNDRERRQVARQVGNMYFKKNITIASVLAYHRDTYFSSHIHRSVYRYSSSTSVFYYQFSYSGDVGVQTEPGVEKTGAAHSDELAYLFNELTLDGEDGIMQRRLVKLWTNFVKHLNPTPLHEDLGTTWEPTRKEHSRVLDISNELKMIDYPHSRTTLTTAETSDLRCNVRMRVESGWVCGLIREAEHGVLYASFRGIPYAKQPLRELRFKELQPVEPWLHHLDATEEGPVCPQYDAIYGYLVKPLKGMSESCIYVNVHVPIEALPKSEEVDELNDNTGSEHNEGAGYPILVFIHGGGFAAGSGDADLYGPEYLVSKGVILITFNYRVILMSGTAIPAFYSASPVYAANVAAIFFKNLGINSTDPQVINQELITAPIEAIVNALTATLDTTGLVSFTPVVEAQHPGVTRIVDDEPINLIQQGRDRHYPMIIGFTNNECETWRRRLQYLQFLRRITKNPALVLKGWIQFSTPPNVALYLAEKIINRYSHGGFNYDDYLRSCTESIFHHPGFQLVRWREKVRAAPSFLYQFSYDSDNSVMKQTLFLDYKGSAHIDDLPFIFRENALLGDQKTFPPLNRDDYMKDWVTMFFINFIRCNNPSCSVNWPPVESHLLNYQLIKVPGVYINTQPTPLEWDMIEFYDKIDEIAGNILVSCCVLVCTYIVRCEIDGIPHLVRANHCVGCFLVIIPQVAIRYAYKSIKNLNNVVAEKFMASSNADSSYLCKYHEIT
ncbi:unnamed protein product [Arctia plantaginis]|uniref:Carboxylesterase type B domain-containing protein n=1 Tax=Arctia plantaginis TaxID=874455 RepID=A0A8S1AUF4_ARCPL|nr:unnamed protein product [Arctia plantaginis]